VRERAESDARSHGYGLNPDSEFLQSLLEGLQQNEERYGYPSCPCRLASGEFHFDRDIVCPCDYRDPDVEEHGCCYCTLYIRKDAFKGKIPITQIPERRPYEKQAKAYIDPAKTSSAKTSERTVDLAGRPPETKMKMWYCRQCGYVCFREEPPYTCPICKAKREMFAEMAMHIDIL
jgi:ferredoxin-thioredoxin reductase catalytic subunit